MDPNYNKKIHFWGRLTLFICMVAFALVPLAIALIFDAAISWGTVATVSPPLFLLFLLQSIAEAVALAPIVGPGALYVANVTGNVSGMKVPAAINAMTQAEVKSGTDKGDAISLIAVCTSAFVTTAIVFLGMVFLAPIFEPIYNNPVIQPAFKNVMPALFGALLIPNVIKAPKDSIVPIIVTLGTLFIGGRAFYTSNQPYLFAAFMVASLIATYFLHKKEFRKNTEE